MQGYNLGPLKGQPLPLTTEPILRLPEMKHYITPVRMDVNEETTNAGEDVEKGNILLLVRG